MASLEGGGKVVMLLVLRLLLLQQQTNDSYRFISKLMDVYLMAGVHQQPDQSNLVNLVNLDQSNYLAEDQT